MIYHEGLASYEIGYTSWFFVNAEYGRGRGRSLASDKVTPDLWLSNSNSINSTYSIAEINEPFRY